MGTTSIPNFLSEEGVPFGRQTGASPALPPCTPFENAPSTQTTAEAELVVQIASLRKDKARLQEHNHLLSSKVDETQQLLHQQHTQNIQTTYSSESLQTPHGRRKYGKVARATPAPSKQLVVPTPRDQPHVPKKVYSDCRHRLNDREAKRQRSPIRISARLRESRMNALGSKSPIRKVRGLDSTESASEYIPSNTQTSTYRSAPTQYSGDNSVSPRRRSEDYGSEEIPSRDPVVRLLFRKIQKMKNDKARSQESEWGKLRPGPFTRCIRRSRQDREVQPLRIPFYTGTEDHLTHLHSFQSAIGCKGLSDEGQCLLFPSSLTEAALNWFYRLEPETREDEPLREYAARFSHEYSRCPETDDRAAYGAFKSGLRSSHFRYLVHSSNWRTYDELMKQAAVHAKAEYFNSKPSVPARRGDTEPNAYPAKTPSYDSIDPYSADHKRKDNRADRRDHPKKEKGRYCRNDNRGPLPNRDHGNEVFTLLNTTYEAVLMNEQEIIPKPNQRRPNRQDNRETGKFCRYHQHNSHNTEDCISLRKIVERLIREGRLDQYIARQPLAPVPNPTRQINMISTISGGPTVVGMSNRSMKQYVRAAQFPQVLGIEVNRHQEVPKVHWEPITFCEEEEEGILYPHDDPMIIRAEIADYDVGRVLIDTGSSVSVILAEAFREMGIGDNQVNWQLTPLLSFSGDLVQPIGSVKLPITFGTVPRKTMTYDQFLIVDCPTAYNVIVGRTALTRVKAHLSPHMLLMKFPTQNGTGAIRGNQLSARTCYATALKATSFKLPDETMSVQGIPNGTGPVDDPRDESLTPHT
ncbi:uncharacterized protein LOC117630595 [Prunus dulcis]|uniref:uncharacterized protein LOC117630595 n=1 Tax=Prunus dulcis TaxID=3755 RepID=UPI0014837D2D|nr:uncharacterized protein LOC117630595 [Prunus dulcis]